MIKEKIISLLCKNGYDFMTAAELATKKITEIKEFFSQSPKTASYTFTCGKVFITVERRI